ncbi:MAG: 4-hydroxy-tetrahydrodipicolinate reductase [Pelagibacteraceae bacterium]|nr:4-hydroxy-tetrahydrodipicolinate reductase [Pelagibacteraceae bacterium]|tara:strand:- start:23554 stop:24363 length:810 start_codon:yes stop_codon:yes gene_type:complete
MAKVKIGIAGCLGRMGQDLIRQILSEKKFKFVGGFEHRSHPSIGKKINAVTDLDSTFVVTNNAKSVFKLADVVIDFTTPQSSLSNAKIASITKTALVIGTTGINNGQKNKIKDFSKKTPILISSNMSMGVNLLFDLVKQAASSLNASEYDIEIAEAHHKHKIDAPSGTALSLGQCAAEGRKTNLNKTKVLDRTKSLKKRKKGDIGFSVTRGGEIAGEHTVSFISKNDRFDLVHKANNRSIFVSGALRAAFFISKQKIGYFDMKALLKLK